MTRMSARLITMKSIARAMLTILLMGSSPCFAQVCDTVATGRPQATVDYVTSGGGPFPFVLEKNASGYPSSSASYAFYDPTKPGFEFLLADPTVLQIDNWYYITGTSDGWKRQGEAPPNYGGDCADYDTSIALSNFRIFKTQNFREFYFHASAFSDANWAPKQRIRSIGGRNFAQLMAPNLFRKPNDTNSPVYMVFHATEEDLVPKLDSDWANASVWPPNPWARPWGPSSSLVNTLWPDTTVPGKYFDTTTSEKTGTGASAWPYWDLSLCEAQDSGNAARATKLAEMTAQCLRYGSIFIVNVPVASFVSPGAGPAFPNANPSWFGYKDAGGTIRTDGGVVAGHEVPTGGAAKIANPNTGLSPAPHQLVRWGWSGMAYAAWGSMEWMSNDACVFFDPNNGNQAYLYYGWADMTSSGEWQGNHIAYHKMPNTADMWELDRTFRTQALAFDRNSNNAINVPDAMGQPVWYDNGLFDWQGNPAVFGTAEGAAVFYWPGGAEEGPGKYIAVYTRNAWASPAYQIVYRVADSVAGLGLGTNQYYGRTATEHVLLASDSPRLGWGHSYGHVDVFWVTWPKAGGGTKKHPYLVFHCKEDYSNNRHPFVKELRWDSAAGKLVRLYEGPGAGRTAYQNVTNFLMPKCP